MSCQGSSYLHWITGVLAPMSCLYMASGDMGADLPDFLQHVLSPSLPSSPSFLVTN